MELMMKKISHSALFAVLSVMAGVAFSATYYPPSEIVETTDSAAAQAVMQQAQEIRMQESGSVSPAKQKVKKSKQGKKKAAARQMQQDMDDMSGE